MDEPVLIECKKCHQFHPAPGVHTCGIETVSALDALAWKVKELEKYVLCKHSFGASFAATGILKCIKCGLEPV